MDNENPNRPQQTGGLKLMTVFIVVLALHVMVIGSITVYYLLHGENSDSDLTAGKDKDLKPALDAANNDGSLPQANSPTAATDASATNAAPVTAVTDASAAPQNTVAATPPVDAAPDLSAPHSVVMPQSHSALDANQAPVNNVTTTDASPAPSSTYVVKAGDTLFKIAKENHLSVTKIKETNNLSSNLLKIGQKLTLPGSDGTIETTAIASAVVPTTSSNAANGTTSILNDAPTTDEATTTVVQPVGTQPRIYTVAKGDTLTKIARKFKTTPTAIMTANNITDPRKLSIGTKLKIPTATPRTNSANNMPKPNQTQTSSAVTPQLVNFHP